jgi:hypothetical protein
MVEKSMFFPLAVSDRTLTKQLRKAIQNCETLDITSNMLKLSLTLTSYLLSLGREMV